MMEHSSAGVDAIEEAVINALCAAHSIEGRDGHHVEALPLDATLSILQRHGGDVLTGPN
jgi:D-aminopeptidase